MSDVWVGLVNRFVEKLFNVKGGPTVVDVDPSVQTVLQLDADNEIRYLEGWNRFGVSQSIAAVAANFGAVRLRNPANSNVIIVIESALFLTTAGAADSPFATWGATVTDFANLANLTFSRIDSRGNPQPTAIVSGVATTAGSNFQQITIPANVTAQFVPTQHCEYTVLPGQIFQIQSAVANTTITVSFLWRERVLETSELT